MSIIAWTYEADFHCPDCAYVRFGVLLNHKDGAYDREGNAARPVFAWDELQSPTHCGDCHEVIYEYHDPLDDNESEAETEG